MSTPIPIEEFGDIVTAAALGQIGAVRVFLRAAPTKNEDCSIDVYGEPTRRA